MNEEDARTLRGWILATGIGVGILVALYFLYWALLANGTNRQNEINQHSNQNQDGLIAQERDRVVGYNAAVDPDQKDLIKSQFCSIYDAITVVPTDLAEAHAKICQ